MPGVGKRVEFGRRSGAAKGTRALTGMGGVGYDAWMSGSNFLSSDRVIAAYLSSHSVKTIKGCTKRHTLEEYAKQIGKRVVYVA